MLSTNKLEDQISFWLKKLNPSGGFSNSANLIISFGLVNHPGTVAHMQRVALIARRAAEILNLDQKAAFCGALLHDTGKFTLPGQLFAEQQNTEEIRQLTTDEFDRIKTHARRGFEILSKHHEFTALCAGLHHNVTEGGYGVTEEDFPPNWSIKLKEKVITIATLISVCDLIDACLTRNKPENVSWTSIQSVGEKKFARHLNLLAAAMQAAQEQKTLYY